MESRRPTAAAFAVALFVVGQLVAFEHEAASRHVTCAQHGEQLHAPELRIDPDDGCGQPHLVGLDGVGGASHEDCTIARLLRTRTCPSHAPQLHVATARVASVEPTAPLAAALSLDVILIAPKTSPPV